MMEHINIEACGLREATGEITLQIGTHVFVLDQRDLRDMEAWLEAARTARNKFERMRLEAADEAEVKP